MARLTIDAYRHAKGARREELLADLDALLDRIDDVAGDSLFLALAQSREFPVTGRRQSLRDLLSELLHDTAELARSRDVEVRCHGPVPDIQVDATRIQLALLNLVINAIKYSDHSKAERQVEIAIEATGKEGEWRIDVRDNGVGIPITLRERIFEESVPQEQDIADHDSKHGIGLHLARVAVEQLGGRLWLEGSEPGAGSTFSLTLTEPRTQLETQPSPRG